MSAPKNQNEWQGIAEYVSTLLEDNQEWIDRYAGYAKVITDKEDDIMEMRRCFYQRKPLYVYSTISDATNAKTKRKNKIEYDLRFHGQSIASIIVENTEVSLIETEEQHKNTESHFGFKYEKLHSGKTDWDGLEARKFRQVFNGQTKKNLPGKSPEHFLESKLLLEFSKKCGAGKYLHNIQPVKLAGAYFQMPTPLTASEDKPKYSGRYGGGIDILSRVRCKGKKLCVMELKDENKAGEPPEKAMQQVVAYAVFVAHLLRSKSRNNWYKIFGFKGNIPTGGLEIIASIIMPGEGIGFEGLEIKLNKLNTIITMRSLYFNETARDGFEFSGSLRNEMLGEE